MYAIRIIQGIGLFAVLCVGVFCADQSGYNRGRQDGFQAKNNDWYIRATDQGGRILIYGKEPKDGYWPIEETTEVYLGEGGKWLDMAQPHVGWAGGGPTPSDPRESPTPSDKPHRDPDPDYDPFNDPPAKNPPPGIWKDAEEKVPALPPPAKEVQS